MSYSSVFSNPCGEFTFFSPWHPEGVIHTLELASMQSTVCKDVCKSQPFHLAPSSRAVPARHLCDTCTSQRPRFWGASALRTPAVSSKRCPAWHTEGLQTVSQPWEARPRALFLSVINPISHASKGAAGGTSAASTEQLRLCFSLPFYHVFLHTFRVDRT